MKTVFLDFATLGPDDLDTDRATEQLENVEFYAGTAAEDIAERIADAGAVVVNKVVLDKHTLQQAPGLQLICLAATGTDNVDLDAAREQGITVCNIREYCTPSVVQHVFALILTLTQRLPEYRSRVQAGDWSDSTSFCLVEPVTRELSGKTLGLIGLGALGSGVAGVARAFNMRVVAARLPWRSAASASSSGQSAPRLALHELLPQADIVSLHCPLTEDTRHIIDGPALELMKRDALLINTARGGLVDYAALLESLKNDEIGGAGIDVLEQEPPDPQHPLLTADLPNLIVTPHMAWGARESRQRALDQIVGNIMAFAAGEPRNQVN